MHTHTQHTRVHMLTHTYEHTLSHMHAHTHAYTCRHTHIHTMHTHMHTRARQTHANTYTYKHLAKYESGGGGSPSQSGIKRGELTNPPWLQACIHTWHTCTYCTYLHMQIHTYTRIHTHNAHILTHMHMCVCV